MRTRSLSSSRTRAAGFSLLELLLVLAISMPVIIAAGWSQVKSLNQNVATAGAGQINLIGASVQSYLANNYVALSGAATTPLTVAQLQAATSCGTSPCLSAAVSATNAWGSGYTILIRRNGAGSPYNFEYAVVTAKPLTTQGGVPYDLLGTAAGQTSPYIGYSHTLSGPLHASGNGNTWSITTANYPAITAAAQMVYFFSQTGLPYDSTYLRMDGSNQMQANLNVGSHGIYGVTQGINDPAIVAASSTTANNDTYFKNANLTGNLALTSGTGDITMASLGTTAPSGGSPLSTTSVTALLPTMVEIDNTTIANGSVVTQPTCSAGGKPAIFLIPLALSSGISNGNWGYKMNATVAGNTWVVSVLDQTGAAINVNPAGFARFFCSYQ